MSYLLDTCALSENLKKNPDPTFVDWVESQDPEDLYISVISIGEIQKGIALLPESSKRTKLAKWFNGELIPFFEDRTLPIDSLVAIEWGKRFAQCQKTGYKPPVIDSLLAATAVTHGITLVTRNTEDFHVLGTSLVNPWES